MESQIIKIGVIKYTNYEERVLLDQNFIVDDLIKIIETDPTFEKFEIFDENGVRILYADVENQVKFNKYFNLDRKHYTEISQDETRQKIEKIAEKNKLEFHVDGFGGNIGDGTEMYTFPKYKGIIVYAIYGLKQYGGTKFCIELEHPEIDDHFFVIFETNEIENVFSFLKRKAGDYTSHIKKENKRITNEREEEYKQYKRDAKKYNW